MPEPGGRSSWNLFILGSALMLLGLAVLSIAPLLECRACEGKGEIRYRAVFGGMDPIHACGTCGGAGRLSLLKRWALRGPEGVQGVP